MKKLFLLKSLLLLCALVAGSSSVWGQDPAAVNTVLWSEDFSGYSADDVPSGSITNSHTGTTVYGGVTLTYATDGGSSTKVYEDTQMGGSTQENLLIAKNNGYLSVSNISTGGASELTITYAKTGSGTLSISTSTTDVAISGSSSGSTIITNGASTLQLTFKNTNSSKNLRIDDIVLTVKTAGSSSGSSVAAPTFSVVAGPVAAGTTVSISQADADEIRYTLNGTDPTKTTGDAYSSPITITTPTTIKAIAIKDDEVSSIATADYTINVAKPTFDVVAGEVYQGTLLTITATTGNTIIYTTDGSNPSFANSNGEIYDSPIAINSAMTVKAIAVDAYENESEITSAEYTVTYPGAVEITPNYSFFGKSSSYSGTAYDEVSGTKDGVKVTCTRNSTNMYASSTAMRFYPSNTLKFEAPTGKTITSIVFTQSNTVTDDMSSTPTGYTSSTKTWSGNATSVTFTRPSNASSYLQFTKLTVILAGKATVAVSGYTTFASDKALDFANATDDSNNKTLKAYVVSDVSKDAVTLTEVTSAPANTGVVLKGNKSTTYSIPVIASAESVGTNLLTPVVDGATVTANSVYVVSGGLFCLFEGTSIPAGKAYLEASKVPASASMLDFDFGGATGIDDGRSQMEDVRGDFYNLSGQRVAQPTKGLYIVNGRKVIIK